MSTVKQTGSWKIQLESEVPDVTDGVFVSDEELIVCRGEPSSAELSRIAYANSAEHWVVREPARRAYRIGLVRNAIAVTCAPDYPAVDDEIESPPPPPIILKLFDLEGRLARSFEIEDLLAIATHHRSSEVYVGTGSGQLLVVSRDGVLRSLAQLEGSIDNLQLSGDCTWLAAADWSGRVHLVNLKDGATERTHVRDAGAGSGIAFSGPRDALVVPSDNELEIFDVHQGRQVAVLQNAHEPLPDTIAEIAASSDGRLILTGTQGTGWVSLWDVETKSLLTHVLEHADHILRVAFSPKGQHFLVVVEGLLRVYSLARTLKSSTAPNS